VKNIDAPKSMVRSLEKQRFNAKVAKGDAKDLKFMIYQARRANDRLLLALCAKEAPRVLRVLLRVLCAEVFF
jgi:hypothetical protein